jgi:hypothetical protein
MPHRLFFDHWRARADFVERLDPHAQFFEANALIWTSLDALANLWARCSQRPRGTDRRRMGDFLATHGGDVFTRASLPALWARADALSPEFATPTIRDRLRLIGGRRAPSLMEERQLRTADEDPTAKQLLDELHEIADREVQRAGRRTWTVADLVLGARFGEIAYEELRCAIVHEGRLGEGAHGFELAESAEGPTYLSGVFSAPPTIGLATGFMVRVMRLCIDGFETEARMGGLNPVPAPHRCIQLAHNDDD